MPAYGSAEAKELGAACISGTAMRRLDNGWVPLRNSKGEWVRCHDKEAAKFMRAGGIMESEVVLGVVTGVLTSGLLWTMKALWTRSIEPYLSKVRYKGLDVSGPWTAIDLNESNAIRFSMDLKQSAHALSGTCMMELYSTDNEFKVMLDVTGDLWEGYISLTLKPEDRKISSYSVALLKVAGGGVALVGGHLFRNVNDEKVDEMSVSFVRGSGNRHHVIAFNEAAAKLQAAYANGPVRHTGFEASTRNADEDAEEQAEKS